MVRGKRVDFKTVLAGPDRRRELMVDTIRATQAREGIETTEEQAERAYYTVSEGEKTAFFDLERFRGGKDELDRRHEMFVLLPMKTWGFGTESPVADTAGGQPCNDENGMRKPQR